MRIAIPMDNGILSQHFGHCSKVALWDVDDTTGVIGENKEVESPVHVPGLFPKWISELQANVIIAGGMGQKAQMLFNNYGIQVVMGAPSKVPAEVVKDYLSGAFTGGVNPCTGGSGECGDDHDHHH